MPGSNPGMTNAERQVTVFQSVGGKGGRQPSQAAPRNPEAPVMSGGKE
jgi:hypothetical protein